MVIFKTKRMNFPLYQSLSKDLPKKDLTVKQKDEFIQTVNGIDNQGRDLIYALIQVYYLENDDIKTEKLPYSAICENIKKDIQNISWNFLDLPINLRHILYKFIKIHIQKLEEEIYRPEIGV